MAVSPANIRPHDVHKFYSGYLEPDPFLPEEYLIHITICWSCQLSQCLSGLRLSDKSLALDLDRGRHHFLFDDNRGRARVADLPTGKQGSSLLQALHLFAVYVAYIDRRA